MKESVVVFVYENVGLSNYFCSAVRKISCTSPRQQWRGFLLFIQHGGGALTDNDAAACNPPGNPFAAKPCSCSGLHGRRLQPSAHASVAGSPGASPVNAGILGALFTAHGRLVSAHAYSFNIVSFL